MASATFDRMEALFKFDHLESRVQEHLKNVYSCLFFALLSATAGAYLHLVSGLFQSFGLLTLFGVIGLLLWLSTIPHEQKNVTKRMAILAGIGFLNGLSLGPLIQYAIALDPSIVMTALLGASVVFGSFSLAALYSKDRSWLYLGGTLMSIVSWMMLGSLMNLFFRSSAFFQVQIYVMLAVYCGFVLYDTQMIVEKRRLGDDDFIWHSIDLFIDFIQIFQKLLIILVQKEENNKKKRNR